MFIKKDITKTNYNLVICGIYITFNGIREEKDGGFSLAYNSAHIASVDPENALAFLEALCVAEYGSELEARA
jgi:hypothetical protein